MAKASPKKPKSPAKTKKPKAAAKSPEGKRKRAKKDPNAPKRGKSAYMFWLEENRARITKPGMAVTDVAKQAGVEWGKVNDKSKWEKLATNDKSRYEKEMASYKAKGGAAGGSPKKAAGKGKKK